MNLNSTTFDNTHFSKPITDAFLHCTKSVQEAQAVTGIPDSIRQYVNAAIADSTRKAYRTDLADFMQWGGAVPATPETIAAYLADRADSLSPITLARRLVAIGRAHTSQGLDDPTKSDLVRTVLRGIRRTNGVAQRQVVPVLKADLLAMLPQMHGTKGLRDRALLLLGFAGAFRRSELVALDYTDLQFVNEGLIVYLRKSKTDQEAVGRKIGVPHGRTAGCPVRALREWLGHAQITAGPIFRSVNKGGGIGSRLSAHAVALIVKQHAQSIGLKAANVSGHSLRAGLATSAAQAGIAAHRIADQTGHRSLEMLRRYIRDGELFVNNAGGIL